MQNRAGKITVLFFGLSLVFSIISLFSQTAKIRITKEQAVLRLKPSDQSLKMRELPIGSEFAVEETVGEWIKIKLPPDVDGIVIAGYVHSSFVEFEIKRDQTKQEIMPLPAETAIKAEPPLLKADDSLISWQKDMTRAKAKLRSGETMAWTGTGVSLIGWAFYFLDKEKTLESELLGYEEKPRVAYLVTAISGIVLSLAGFMQSEAASNEIEALQLEGTTKGYITGGIGLIKGGIAFQIAVSF